MNYSKHPKENVWSPSRVDNALTLEDIGVGITMIILLALIVVLMSMN